MNTESKITDAELEQIKEFTRSDVQEEELYTFSVILCDNDIDRDGDKFTAESLRKLAELFIGKTGIFDHNPTSQGQTARIYDASVKTDEERKTKDGEPYTFIEAKAYMIRTEGNRDLISEIEGGIKKETSVNCRMGSTLCSVCGRDMSSPECTHIRGKSYGSKICSRLLLDPEDAYEWSFVAVPAQRNAGVIKSFGFSDDDRELIGEFRDEMTESVIKAGSRVFPSADPGLLSEVCSAVPVKVLRQLRDSLVKEARARLPLVRQLDVSPSKNENNSEYII